MLRTKKKQLNLKPNRVLDKRTSRGMLYENEELRIRTIHINDEVEKSHHDIKKLRKENEYLKREIWNLRDECEKLEEVIKKVYAGEDLPTPEELPQYQPLVRKQSNSSLTHLRSRRGSSVALSFYEDDDTETKKEEDEEEEDEQELDEERDAGDEEEVFAPSLDGEQQQDYVPLIGLGFDNLTLNDGEDMRFLIDSRSSMSNSDVVVVDDAANQQQTRHLVYPGCQHPSTAETTPQALEYHRPTIEITPASSGSSFMINKDTFDSAIEMAPDVQDLGCVIVLSKMYQNEVHIPDNDNCRSHSPLETSQSTASNSSSLRRRRSTTVPLVPFHQSEPALYSRNQYKGVASNEAPPIVYEHPPDYTNVVIGFLPFEESFEGLSTQEVVDDLETQFDASLEKVSSVRLVSSGEGSAPPRLFISLRSSSFVSSLVGKGLLVRQKPIRLLAADSTPTATVLLSGLPSATPDPLVTTVLNRFGHVVSLERRSYKGIDTSERLLRMHLVKPLPLTLVIAGYDVNANILQAPPTSLGEMKAPPPSPSPPPGTPLGPLRTHKPVARSATYDCTSTTPNPHQAMGPTAAAVQRRKMSICSAVADTSNAIPAPAGAGSGQKVTMVVSTTNANGKKPLQRTAKPYEGHPITGSEDVTRKMINRSVSCDPKRIASNNNNNNNNSIKSACPSEQSLTDSTPSVPSQSNLRFGTNSTPVSRQPSRNYAARKSSLVNNNNIISLDKKEPLPWCGCWGNGCI